jgi:hypothetical protein
MPDVIDVVLSYIPLFGQSVKIYFAENSVSYTKAKAVKEMLGYVTRPVGLFEEFMRDPQGFAGARSKLYMESVAEINRAMENPEIDFVFSHLNAPHSPFIYDSRVDAFSNGVDLTYTDKLELVDRTLGIIQDRMKENGVWDKSTVIVTADHGWWDDPYFVNRDLVDPLNAPDYRNAEGGLVDPNVIRRRHSVNTGSRDDITTMIKLPGQASAVEFNDEFDSSRLNAIIQAILIDGVTEPDALTRFIQNLQ